MSGGVNEKKNRSGYSFNNTVRVLLSGSDFFNSLETLIDSALHEIHFQTYIFEEDETGKRIAEALIRAAKREVKIFMLLDAYGSNNLSEKFVKTLCDAGIELRWFGPLFRKGSFHIGRRLHRKVIVADRSVSIVSGINISNNYNDLPQNRAWLDFGVLVKGEVSAKLHLICRQSWLKIRFGKLSKKLTRYRLYPVEEPGSSTVKIRVRENDWKIGKSQTASNYHHLIRHAQESLTIVGGYFLPGRKARRLLRKASARGVVLNLIVAERSDVGLMRNAMLYLYDWLLRNNIRIYEYEPSNVHGKVIIADKKIVSVGSYDMNTLSTYSNIELNLEIDDTTVAGNFNDTIEKIIRSDCKEITETKLKTGRGLRQRIAQWIAYKLVKALFLISVWLAKKDRGETYQ